MKMSRIFRKPFGGEEVDSKQILSGHAAYMIVRRRSSAVSKTNTILLCNTILFLRLWPKLNELFKGLIYLSLEGRISHH